MLIGMSDTDTYSTGSVGVGIVAKAYGVTPATIRMWDGITLKSFRTAGNQRRFKLSENPELAALLSPSTPTARPVDDPPVSAGRASSVVEGRA